MLRRDIFTGKYAVGGRLPPERDIADLLGVSRVTVRQALQELAKEEWIEIVQGRGITVLDFSRRIGLDVLPTLLSSCPQAVVTPDVFRTMHDIFNWLTKQICISAARHAGTEHEQKLLNIIHEYKEEISVQDYFEIESRFYYELLAIGNDFVLKMFFNTYIKTFSYLVESKILQAPPLPRYMYIDINTDLIKAICRNNADQIETIINGYKPVIQAALNHYLKAIGIDID